MASFEASVLHIKHSGSSWGGSDPLAPKFLKKKRFKSPPGRRPLAFKGVKMVKRTIKSSKSAPHLFSPARAKGNYFGFQFSSYWQAGKLAYTHTHPAAPNMLFSSLAKGGPLFQLWATNILLYWHSCYFRWFGDSESAEDPAVLMRGRSV